MLEGHQGFATRNIDFFRNELIANLGARTFEANRMQENFACDLRWSKRQNVTLVRLICNSGTQVEFAPASFVRQYFPIGRMSSFALLGSHGAVDEATVSSYPVVPAEIPFRLHANSSHQFLLLRIEQAALKAVLCALTGESRSKELRLGSGYSADPRQLEAIKQATIQFASDLDLWGIAFPAIAYRELEQSLIVRFLLANSSNFSGRLARQEPAPSSQQLHQVRDFIEANWDKPLNIDNIARLNGISVRALFRLFKRENGYTPTAFLKSIRLQKAKEMLQAFDANSSVMRVALKCGFRSLGHFSADYQRAFGELPSETSRRAR